MDITITIAVIVISICCVITIKIFTKDGKHDLEIQAGKFRLSIKKHEIKCQKARYIQARAMPA